MTDPTEPIRRERLAEINAESGTREALEAQYGKVWTTAELAEDFGVIGFMAPLVIVRRKADSVKGSLEFQHQPGSISTFRRTRRSDLGDYPMLLADECQKRFLIEPK
jgi:hypothetical protein